MSSFSLLSMTEDFMAKKIRLPVLREEFFWPTEASVELEPIHPGEKNIMGGCNRAAYYRYVGGFKSEPYTPYSHWTFLTGNSYEAGLREIWKQMGMWVDNSVKFRSKEKHVSGEIDVILKDPNTGAVFPVELKSYQGYEASKNLKGNPKKFITGQPKDAHLLQILLYLDLHQHIFTFGKLIYIDKVCKDNVEFDISLRKEGMNTYPVINGAINRKFSVEQIYERYAELQKYIDAGTVPPRDFELEFSPEKIEREFAAKNLSKTKYELYQKKGIKPGSWNCGWCRYKKECYGLNEIIDTDDSGDE